MPIPLFRLPVSKGAKLVLSYLWRYAGRERFVWVDQETIASDLGIESDRTMRRLLGELRKAGAIEEDEQVRQGRVRRGWWLSDGRDVGTSDVGTDDVGGEGAEAQDELGGIERENDERTEAAGSEASVLEAEAMTDSIPSAVDRNDRGRPKMAASAVKNDRGRTKMAASAVKNDRATSLELPGNQSSLSFPPAASPGSPTAGGDEQDRVRGELDRLRRWRVHGGDPEGLGAWPTPTPPGGVALPRLAMGGKLTERLREERTAEELHRAVHLVAELVEAGELVAEKWRATYVFSGWLDELVVRAVALRAKRAQEEQKRDEARREHHGRQKPEPARLSRDEMIETLAELKALQPVAQGLRTPARPAKKRRPPSDPETELDLLNLRIEVQAVAEQLGREPKDVLAELGRSSMRELEIGDGERLRMLLLEASRAREPSGSQGQPSQ